MSKLTEIIMLSGIINPDTVREIQRWRLPLGEVPERGEYDAELSPSAISRAIAEAIENQGYVFMRETDLMALPQYLKTMKPATLHIDSGDGDPVEFEVTVGKTPNGDWLLPWQSESITDMLTDGKTFLRVDKHRVYFSQARELFYGQHKAFIVCVPSTLEAHGDPG